MAFRKLYIFILVLLCSNVNAEFSGNIAIEGRYFSDDGLFFEQDENSSASISFQPEFRHQWNNGNNGFTFIPYARLDSLDDERTHADIRELFFLSVNNNWEWRLGLNKVFWGVLEFQHIVDIINQTDAVENLDTEDKLGQPMLHLGINKDSGLYEVFLLPYFRERTFPGADGRLRSGLVVDTDNPLYESSDEEQHFDFALRWSHYFGNNDIAISWFDGTAREPIFQLNQDQTLIVPFYQQIEQFGLEYQYTGEEWLWKLEAIHQTGLTENFWAAGAGFEYTFVGINQSNADLGVLMEYHYDERDADQSALQSDLFFGARLALNDIQSSELLAGIGVDLDDQSRSIRVEASRRMGDSIKINLETQYFSKIDSDNVLYDLRNDSHIQLEFVWYF